MDSDLQPIHTISLFVANKPGVLLRVALIFSRRGYNIESLVVSSALDGLFSRMTITAKGDPAILEQIIKQAAKLVDVVHAAEHKNIDAVETELALIKVKKHDEKHAEILQVVDHYKGRTLDFSDDTLIVQISGATDKIDAFVEMMKPYGVIELVRTGKVVMARGQEDT